jgi:hypothetical protein
MSLVGDTRRVVAVSAPVMEKPSSRHGSHLGRTTGLNRGPCREVLAPSATTTSASVYEKVGITD